MRLPLLLAAVIPAFACQVVDGDRILGKDVAAASPWFAALDAHLDIGAAPLPGVQRVLRPEELVHLAKQTGILMSEPSASICFERATQPLTPEQLLPALRQALGLEDATIELLDFSRFGVPRGTLEFSKASLMPNGMWRGRLLYDQNHSMAVWVKARITVQRTWVEASETLAVGQPIEASQLIQKTGPRFPLDMAFLSSMELVSGRRPARTLPAGTAITQPMLRIVHDIERGDRVAVEVKVGSAILDFEATAESSGRTGDSILVKNPDNGKSFQARIQDKRHVLVETK